MVVLVSLNKKQMYEIKESQSFNLLIMNVEILTQNYEVLHQFLDLQC